MSANRECFFRQPLVVPSTPIATGAMVKRPAAAVWKRPAASTSHTKVFKTHLKRWSELSMPHAIKAVVYGMSGMETVTVETYHCQSLSCRRTFGPNFYHECSQKHNTASFHDIKDVLFVSNKCGFTTDYLRYHSYLEFRGPVSASAIQDTYKRVYKVHYDSQSPRPSASAMAPVVSTS